MRNAREWQFDGLVGPTHNYAGLAHGNLAAQTNAGAVSNPRQAALQGLEKMRFVHELGVPQAFIPPHFRPVISELKRLGFDGPSILQQVADDVPGLLNAVYSSSFMWTANAATVTPSSDSGDGKVHLTPANMTSHYHRAIEAEFTQKMLGKIFHNTGFFSVHNFLPSQANFGDEGAANHMVVSPDYGIMGTHIFVYGGKNNNAVSPKKFPARQQWMASEAIARLHRINPEHRIFLQQSPEVIDLGVFHNDVIAMNTTRRMMVHERAFTGEGQARLRDFAAQQNGLRYCEITEAELSVQEAVATYFFNSQVLDLGDDRFALIAPLESQEHPRAHAALQRLQADGIISEIHIRDLRESMRNGGGPACLRLRVVMTPEEAAAIHPGVILTDATYEVLKQWITKHYRDRLTSDDLRDPFFVTELETTYLALEKLIGMPGLYGDSIHR